MQWLVLEGPGRRGSYPWNAMKVEQSRGRETQCGGRDVYQDRERVNYDVLPTTSKQGLTLAQRTPIVGSRQMFSASSEAS